MQYSVDGRRPAVFYNSRKEEGNIYGIIGAAENALRQAGRRAEASSIFHAVDQRARNYEEALKIISKFVDLFDIAE